MSKGGKGCPNEQTLNTRELVAKDLDMSSTVLGKAQYIYNNASEENRFLEFT